MVDNFFSPITFLIHQPLSNAYKFLIVHLLWGHSLTCPTVRERSVYPLRSSEDDPKTSLNQHQSLSGEILPRFDINKKKLEKSPFHPKL